MIIQWIWGFSHNFWRNPATESSSLAPPCYRQWHCIWVPPQMLAQGSGFLSIRSALGSFRSKQCNQRENIPLPKGKNTPRHFSLLLDLVILRLIQENVIKEDQKSNFRQYGEMEKQRWEESEKRREEERRSEKRKSQKTEDAGAGNSSKVAAHCVFPRESKSRLAKVRSRLGR